MKHSAIESEPTAAKGLCGDALDTVRAYTRNLGLRGEQLGLIGPDEARRLWSRHILNCALLAPELPAQGVRGGRASIADVGSGAGLPGLVIAMIRPDIDVTLIEPLERRTRWLVEQVQELDLSNVSIFTGRAEDYAPRQSFDVVTARAVKALKGLVPMLAPLVVPGGQLALLKGQRIDAEIDDAQPIFHRHRVTEVKTQTLGLGTVDEPTRLFTATVG